jgi:hypothetical protein
LPQVHAPLEHPSAPVAEQAVQAFPPAPQAPSDAATHEPAAQQPSGHETASQPQAPLTQRRPSGQGGPLPQAHPPVIEQLSALSELQAAQAAPPAPQLMADGGRQVAPEQHPAAQPELVQPLHTPALQLCPAGQGWQAPPPAPHEAGLVPGRHAPFAAQQPSGHERMSHTQPLPMQRWPGRQAAPVPQRQPPAVEQLSASTGSQVTHVDPASPHESTARSRQRPDMQQPLGHELASHTHWPPAQRCPPAQARFGPQWHMPPGPHPSALVGSQVWQAAPAIPHVGRLRCWHTLPAQQPSGQETASHMHAPESQRWPAPQAARPPQRHSPVTLQLSAMVLSQAWQAPPVVPQVDTERG